MLKYSTEAALYWHMPFILQTVVRTLTEMKGSPWYFQWNKSSMGRNARIRPRPWNVVMYPYYTEYVPNFKPQSEDVASIQYLYGKS